jgi:energy-coupling factor transport system ATP-binding protein
VVEDEILYGLENFSVPREEVETRLTSSLDMVGISHLRNRNIDTLSGGQKQKVAIAAIIALKPKILVLDEPTGELDPQSSLQIFRMLKELNEKYGITVIVVEQKIMLLCEFAKNLAVMSQGKLIIHGSIRNVLEKSEKLEQLGINCPRMVTLSGKLKEKGFISEVCITVDEAEKMARRLICD